MILFGQAHVDRVLREYVAHHRTERPHQGLGNELVEQRPDPVPSVGEVVEDERLGGLLRSYRRAVA